MCAPLWVVGPFRWSVLSSVPSASTWPSSLRRMMEAILNPEAVDDRVSTSAHLMLHTAPPPANPPALPPPPPRAVPPRPRSAWHPPTTCFRAGVLPPRLSGSWGLPQHLPSHCYSLSSLFVSWALLWGGAGGGNGSRITMGTSGWSSRAARLSLSEGRHVLTLFFALPLCSLTRSLCPCVCSWAPYVCSQDPRALSSVCGALVLCSRVVCVWVQDLFKRMNNELRRQANDILSRSNRATQFDIAKVCLWMDEQEQKKKKKKKKEGTKPSACSLPCEARLEAVWMPQNRAV